MKTRPRPIQLHGLALYERFHQRILRGYIMDAMEGMDGTSPGEWRPTDLHHFGSRTGEGAKISHSVRRFTRLSGNPVSPVGEVH